MRRRVEMVLLALALALAGFAGFSQQVQASVSVPEGYIGIYTKEDLNNVRNNLAGKYILMNDITFTASDFASGGAYYNSGEGWSPIGGVSKKPFTGVFDGNYHTISNLKIYSTNQLKGLFGQINGGSRNARTEPDTAEHRYKTSCPVYTGYATVLWYGNTVRE